LASKRQVDVKFLDMQRKVLKLEKRVLAIPVTSPFRGGFGQSIFTCSLTWLRLWLWVVLGFYFFFVALLLLLLWLLGFVLFQGVPVPVA